MSTNRRQPPRVYTVFTAGIALIGLTTIAVEVFVDGSPMTGFRWAILVLNIALLAGSIWAYRRASKPQPPSNEDTR